MVFFSPIATTQDLDSCVWATSLVSLHALDDNGHWGEPLDPNIVFEGPL